MESPDAIPSSRQALPARPDPCTMVLFGAGGDLTKRKLIPAMYNLAKSKLLPEQFAIVGVSIEPFSHEEFRQRMTNDVQQYSVGGVDRASLLLASPRDGRRRTDG